MEQCEIKQLPYEIFETNRVKRIEKPFSNVVGHSSQKEILLSVLDWFRNSREWKNKGIDIPRGVILYGQPGNGKSLLIKEAIKYANTTTFIFKGDETNISESLEETFRKAKENGHSLVVIDELDLLIEKDERATRILQDNLDGIENTADILVLCATNNIWSIPEPLKRCGRLEKVLRIPSPSGQEAVELIKKLFLNLNVDLPNDFDEMCLALTLNEVSFSTIKSIVNETILKNGFENITSEMLYESIFDITNEIKSDCSSFNFHTAVHEAGHALVALYYKQFYKIGRLTINNNGGYLSVVDIDKDFNSHEKLIADIHVGCAGLLAEKVVFKNGSEGCNRDMQDVYLLSSRLVNRIGYKSCADTLPKVNPYQYVRRESEKKLRKNEKASIKIAKKCEKETTRFLKRNKSLLIELADKLYDKKNLNSMEVLEIVNHRKIR